MTRERLKGLTKVKKALASGKTIYYCYAWRGGPLLKHKDGSPIQPGDPLLVRAFVEATKNKHVDPSETLGRLIKEYRASPEFTEKAEKTRREYGRYLDLIDESDLAKMSFEAIQDKEARGDFKDWRDTMADRPRTADYAWTTLARVLSFAKDRGRISVNVCEKGGRLYAADRAESIWTDEHLTALEAVASAEVRAALMLALWTGQRKGDLLLTPWSAYDGKTIKVKQSKTGARVNIPVGKDLKVMLDGMTKHSPVILTNSRHKPWTSDGFDTSWQKAVKKAKIEGLTFHDLRGTAVTRLALAGCSNSQIASITGHSLRDVDAILDAHYLGGRNELAVQAIAKLEEFQGKKK